jgi:hypothetical protein
MDDFDDESGTFDSGSNDDESYRDKFDNEDEYREFRDAYEKYDAMRNDALFNMPKRMQEFIEWLKENMINPKHKFVVVPYQYTGLKNCPMMVYNYHALENEATRTAIGAMGFPTYLN